MTMLGNRIDRLAHRVRPVSCFSGGSHCTMYALVGDGSDNPLEPQLPARCPACGRPHLHRMVRLIGVDVARI